jgi:hypothetical protein
MQKKEIRMQKYYKRKKFSPTCDPVSFAEVKASQARLAEQMQTQESKLQALAVLINAPVNTRRAIDILLEKRIKEKCQHLNLN